MKHLATHVVLFVIAQLIFVLLGYSWAWELVSGNVPASSIIDTIHDPSGWWVNVSRIWCLVLLADVLITLLGGFRKRR